MLNQLFTVNLPEARSPQASAIYHYSDALSMCVDSAGDPKFSTVARFACPAGAHRRGLAEFKGVEWLSLPLVLERWQQTPITLFTATQQGAVLDLQGSTLIVELISSDPILMLEACELALAALALDWNVRLLLSNSAAQRLSNKNSPAHLKAFGSLPLFGLSQAMMLENSSHDTQDFTFANTGEFMLPVFQISAGAYAAQLAQSCRITI